MVLAIFQAALRPLIMLTGNLVVSFLFPRSWRDHVDPDTPASTAIGFIVCLALLGLLIAYIRYHHK